MELIVPSNKTKEALIHYGLKQKNIYTIPTGLELERFSVNNKNNKLCQSLIEKYHLQNHVFPPGRHVRSARSAVSCG